MSALLPVGACSSATADLPADLAAAKSDQPFSLFLGEELGQIDYAQLKVRNKCLAKAGYPQNLNTMLEQPRNPFRHLLITARSFGPTSAEEAKRVGFGRDSLSAPPSVISFDPSYDKAYDRCTDIAWKELSDDAKKVYYGYFDLGNNLSQPLSPTVNERMGDTAWRKLLSCLGDKGHRPQNEQEFLQNPNPGFFGVPVGVDANEGRDRWKPKQVPGTIEVGPAVPAAPYHAGPAESALALAWFECRRATGIDKKQLETAVQVQRELVAKYESSFIELNPQVTRLAKQAAQLIGAP
ncbi:hypothetical protein AB0H28_20190 [Micromonospora sp. NPDC050980]|uniref:hypothetical protein n=1 Tax=Micromonospora sp. NPDC050980 TaxID=3155161 RepID=UPI0033F101C3